MLMPVAYFDTITYTVVLGDNLYTISHKYNSTVENVLKFNNILNPKLIYPGQKIVIPLSPPEAIIYTVKPGDTVYSIARRFGTYVRNIVEYNYLTDPNLIHPGQHLVVTASLR
jgi:LysM repeat protein